MSVPFLSSPWFFLIMKFITLALLYLFVYRIVAMIVRDVSRNTAAPFDGRDADLAGFGLPDGQNWGLVVVESTVSDLREGTKYPVKKGMTIGRGKNNAIQINDSFVSHEHARVYVSDGEFAVEDLHSKNGTLVDGERINKSVSLDEGAFLQVGGVTFKLVRWNNESS